MATLTESFIGEVNKLNTPELSDAGWNTGIQLAQLKQQREQQAQMIKQKQEELQMAKIEKVGGWFETASKMEDGPAKKSFLSGFIPNGIQALGVQDAFHPESLKMMTTDPLIVPYMSDKIRRGETSFGEVIKALGSPDATATILGSNDYKQFGAAQENKDALQESIGVLKKSAEFAATEEGKAYRAKIAAEAQKGKVGVFQQGANVKTDEQASNSGKTIDKAAEPLLQPFRNLEKGLNRLHPKDGSKPSWTIINEVAQDASNALSGARLSSDFKLKEIKQESIDQMLGDLAYKAKSDPNQPANDATIKFWDNFMTGLKGDYSQQIARKTKEAGAEADTAFAHNPQAQKVTRNKVKRYQTGEAYRSDGIAHINVDGQDYNLKKAKAIAEKNPNDPFSKKILEAISQVEGQ